MPPGDFYTQSAIARLGVLMAQAHGVKDAKVTDFAPWFESPRDRRNKRAESEKRMVLEYLDGAMDNRVKSNA